MKKKTKVVILGAGISGLSCAWHLLRKSKDYEIILLEKENQAGGWVATHETSGFLFEKGPRTLKPSRCHELLELIGELGLHEELIFAEESSKVRYLWLDGKLQRFPLPLMNWSTLKAFIREWNIAPKEEEETIEQFALRRFNAEIASRLFDPLTLGVYAGDIRKLSINACFPFFKEMERREGSLTKALIKALFRRKKSQGNDSLFSFKQGLQTLVDALVDFLEPHIQLQQEVMNIQPSLEGFRITTQNHSFEAQVLISALPPHQLARLFHLIDKEIGAILNSIQMRSIYMLHLGYSQQVFNHPGFGYLIPSREKENILGVVFDSKIFPGQNRRPQETRLTVMLREEEPIQMTLKKINQHLNIRQNPEWFQMTYAASAIPQFELGHEKKIHALRETIEDRYGNIHLLGNYLEGASLNDCVKGAKVLAQQLSETKQARKRLLTTIY